MSFLPLRRASLLIGLVAMLAASLVVVNPNAEPAGATVCEPALNSCWDEAFYAAYAIAAAESAVPIAEASIPILLELANWAVAYCDTYPTCDDAIATAISLALSSADAVVQSANPETALRLSAVLLELATSLVDIAVTAAPGIADAAVNSVGPLSALALELANAVVVIAQDYGTYVAFGLETAALALEVSLWAAALARSIAEPIANTVVANLTAYVQNQVNNPVGLAEASLSTALGLVSMVSGTGGQVVGDAQAAIAPTISQLQAQLNAILAMVPSDPAGAVAQIQSVVDSLLPQVDAVAAMVGGIPTLVLGEAARLAAVVQGCAASPSLPCTGNDVTITPGTCYQIQSDATYHACIPEGVNDTSSIDPASFVLGLVQDPLGTTSPQSDPGGNFVNPWIWEWDHTYAYSQCVLRGFPPTLHCKYIGAVRFKASLVLDGFEATMKTESTVMDGPAVKTDHFMECREDDFRDASCGGPWEDGYPGYTRERFYTLHKAFKKKTDKFFWNFSFEWGAFGWSGEWATPNYTTPRYVCNGAWENPMPGQPCYFLDAPGAPDTDLPYQKLYL